MPLEYSTAVVIMGILAIVLILYFLDSRTLDGGFDTHHVVMLLKKDYPDFVAERVVFDSGGKGALVMPKPGSSVGLVWQGRWGPITRLLTKELVRLAQVDGPQFTLKLNEARLRSVTLLIDDPDDILELKRAFRVE